MSDSIEDLLKKLKDAGITPGEWSETPEKEVAHPFLEKQKGALKQVRDLLVQQIEKDTKELQRLQELKKKIKHGGNSDG